MKGIQSLTLYDARDMPAMRMSPSPDPICLREGEWALLQNMRRDRRRVRSRNGSSVVTTSAIQSSGQFRGAWEGTIGAARYMLVAFSDGTDIFVRRSADGGSSWSEITAPSGKFGKTRFADTGAHLRFCAVRDPLSGREVVVIQNGAEGARLWDPGGGEAGQLQTAVHVAPALPDNASAQTKAMPSFYNYFPVSGASNLPTFASTGTGLTFAMNGSSPQNNLRLTIATTVTANATATATWGTPLSKGQVKQLLALYESVYALIWDSLKVEASADGATWFTVYDPTDTKYAHLETDVDPEHAGRYVAGLYLEHVTPTSIDRLRFTFVGAAAPSANQTIDFVCLTLGGMVPGGAQYKVSYYNPASMGESYSLLALQAKSERLVDVGGRLFAGDRFPVSTKLYYTYKITVQYNSQAELDKGVSEIRFYRKDNGQTSFKYAQRLIIGTWSGAVWSHVSVAALALRTVTENVSPETLNAQLVAPDGDHESIPIGRAMLFANGGRLFVGAKSSGGTYSIVYISESRHPFRFKAIPGTAQTSATSWVLPGENIQMFQGVATSVLGASSVYVFTDRRVAVTDGLTVTNLSRYSVVSTVGTIAPFSVAENLGEIYFVDTRLQVRVIAGGVLKNISRDEVDSILRSVPAARREHLQGIVANDYYALGYTPASGGSNTRALIWNTVRREWEADDSLPAVNPYTISAERWISRFDVSLAREQLFVFAADARLYEYDVEGVALDLGQKIAISMKTRAIHFGMDRKFTVARVGAYAEADSGTTLTITRTYGPGGTLETSSLVLNTAESHAMTWDENASSSAQPIGATCQITIAGAMTGHKGIFRLDMEYRMLDGQGRRGKAA